MQILTGILLGLVAWFLLRILLMGVYTVDQNERAVKTRFGRAVRVPGGKTTLDDPVAESLRPEERERYTYPHCCPVRSRIESVGCRHRAGCPRSPMLGGPV